MVGAIDVRLDVLDKVAAADIDGESSVEIDILSTAVRPLHMDVEDVWIVLKHPRGKVGTLALVVSTTCVELAVH
eukprot:5158165-Prymnesium_polylepis.1